MGQALFDTAASNYDDNFTNSIVGSLQRKRVYFWLRKVDFFTKNESVFELNCGTGFDAEQFNKKGMSVRATDISFKMIEVCKQNRSQSISFSQLDCKDIDSVELSEDVIFSNFGGLNCLSENELEQVLASITNKQVKGNMVVLIFMPKFSLMESMYLFLKLKWKIIFRRFTNSAIDVNVDGINVPTYFHTPRKLKKLLRPHYNIKLLKPVALFIPPSYFEPLAKRHPKLVSISNKLEYIFGRFTVFSGLSDHFIIVAEKK